MKEARRDSLAPWERGNPAVRGGADAPHLRMRLDVLVVETMREQKLTIKLKKIDEKIF